MDDDTQGLSSEAQEYREFIYKLIAERNYSHARLNIGIGFIKNRWNRAENDRLLNEVDQAEKSWLGRLWLRVKRLLGS